VDIGAANGWGLPVSVGVDYAIHNDITIGIEGSYATEKYSGDIKGSWLGIGANGNYHFNTLLKIPNKWDIYAGATLAYNSFSYKYNGTDYDYFDGKSSGIGFAGQAGADISLPKPRSPCGIRRRYCRFRRKSRTYL
jgi:outer membrane protein W